MAVVRGLTHCRRPSRFTTSVLLSEPGVYPMRSQSARSLFDSAIVPEGGCVKPKGA